MMRRTIVLFLAFGMLVLTVGAVDAKAKSRKKAPSTAEQMDRLQERVSQLEALLAQQSAKAADPDLQARKVEELEKKVLESARAPKPKVPDWVDKMGIDGKAYVRYSKESGNLNSGNNEFNIDRVYLGYSWKISDRVKFRYLIEAGEVRDKDYTLDAGTLPTYNADGTMKTPGTLPKLSTSEKNFDALTKQAYIEFKEPLGKDTWFKVGLHDNPWTGWMDGTWGYRFHNKNMTDRAGYISSTDNGFSFGGKFDKGYGDWQLSYMNGENWGNREIGRSKDVMGRITLNPMGEAKGKEKFFFLSAGAFRGTYEGMAAAAFAGRNRTLFAVGYKEPEKLTLIGEWTRMSDPTTKMRSRYPSLAARIGAATAQSDARGSALYASLNLSLFGDSPNAKKWELLGRFDRINPDVNVMNNDVKTNTFGISYRWEKNLQTLLAFETVGYGAAEKAPGVAGFTGKLDERRVILTTEVKY